LRPLKSELNHLFESETLAEGWGFELRAPILKKRGCKDP